MLARWWLNRPQTPKIAHALRGRLRGLPSYRLTDNGCQSAGYAEKNIMPKKRYMSKENEAKAVF